MKVFGAGRGVVEQSATTLTSIVRSLNPITSGHAVVTPTRNGVQRISELTEDEAEDFFATAVAVAAATESRSPVDNDEIIAFNYSILDGPSTGPPVPAVHLHIIPRHEGDFANNDDVYTAINKWTPIPGKSNDAVFSVPADNKRIPRSDVDMAEEALRYRNVTTNNSDADTIAGIQFSFSKFKIPGKCLFYLSPSGSTVGFVNLKPLAPGHVLVSPMRCVPRICEMTPAESSDLWRSVRQVQALLAKVFSCDSFKVAVQDGVGAGQSVPHVHVHLIPRMEEIRSHG